MTASSRGGQVALWPLTPCGRCYPCTIGRQNVCVRFSLIGIHEDGGLQERLLVADTQVFPIAGVSPQVAALVEPVSIAVRAVHRARIADGERVVVLGAGPIGQSLLVAAQDRGASVLLVDPLEQRLELARALGAETVPWTTPEDVVAAARSWSGGGGPHVVIDATAVPEAVAAGVEMVVSAGRFVQVGMSDDAVPFRHRRVHREGARRARRRLLRRGRVRRSRRRWSSGTPTGSARLVSHEFPLAEAPEALHFAMTHPTDVMKVVVRGG